MRIKPESFQAYQLQLVIPGICQEIKKHCTRQDERGGIVNKLISLTRMIMQARAGSLGRLLGSWTPLRRFLPTASMLESQAP